MRYTIPLCALAFACFPVARGAEEEASQYEERYVERVAERATWAERTNRARWLRELKGVFPNQVTEPTTEADYMAWFDLLARNGDEWKKSASNDPRVAKLFDSVADRRRLGPVPAITRAEFSGYVKRVFLRERAPSSANSANWGEYADRVFRVIDRDGDGELLGGELTTLLNKSPTPVDADANGRITQDEYRDAFRRMVEARAEVFRKQAAQPDARSGDRRDDDDDDDDRRDDRRPTGWRADPAEQPDDEEIDEETGLPEWFAELDTNEDEQVSLFEWRWDERDTEEFQAMDLDEDSLLTEDEYFRFLELKQTTEEKRRRELGR